LRAFSVLHGSFGQPGANDRFDERPPRRRIEA